MGNAIQIGTGIVTFFTFVAIVYYANQLRKSSNAQARSNELQEDAIESQNRSIKAQLASITFPVVATAFNQGKRNYEDNDKANEDFGAPGLNFKFSKNRPFYVYISFQSTKSESGIQVYHPWMLTENKVGVHPGESKAKHRNDHNLEENRGFEKQLAAIFKELGSSEENVIGEVGILFESAARQEFFYSYTAEFQFRSKINKEVELTKEGKLNFDEVYLHFYEVEPMDHLLFEENKELDENSKRHFDELRKQKWEDRQGSENSESRGEPDE